MTVDALYSVAGWLRDEDRLPSDAVPAMGRWRAKLKAEWQEITDEEVRPIRRRHSELELCLLFKHVHHADVDPRFALHSIWGANNDSDRYYVLEGRILGFR